MFGKLYLGVPLSLSRLRSPDEQPLVDAAAARIPTWKAGLLTCAGRVVLTKVTLSAIPVHISIAACLSDWDIQQIDRRRREVTSGGKCKISWSTVICRPTCYGGLGFLDLRFFGFALRLPWEWLKRVQPERAWASLPARPEKVVAAMCSASLSVVIGDGAAALF